MKIDERKCIKCGLCVGICPFGGIILKDRPVFTEKCKKCGLCAKICPVGAIEWKT